MRRKGQREPALRAAVDSPAPHAGIIISWREEGRFAFSRPCFTPC